MTDNERVIAHQSQEKFQFYSVALTFTILGLSIQTSSFDGLLAAQIGEIVSWAFLLSSGLLGLSHLEWSPAIRIQMVRKEELEEGANRLKVQKVQGASEVNILQERRTISIDERIQQFETYAAKLDEQIRRLDGRSDLKYRWFRWTFVVGMVLLVASRAIDPVIGIYEAMRGAT